MRIGLVGKENNKGLGTLTYYYVKNLPITKLIIWVDENTKTKNYVNALYCNKEDFTEKFWLSWLYDMDVLIMLERCFDDAVRISILRGIKTILMVNYEYLNTSLKMQPDIFWCSSKLNFEKTPYSDSKKILLPIPVDKECFPFALRNRRIRKILCQSGTDGLNGYNGVDLIIDAIDIIQKRYPDIGITLDVQVPDKLSSGAICPKSAPGINIIRTSYNIPSAEQYKDYDLFICLQTFRATSLPIQEAMSCGIPVLTTDIFPFRDIVRNEKLLTRTLGYVDTPEMKDNPGLWGFSKIVSFNQMVRMYKPDISNLVYKIDQLVNYNESDVTQLSYEMGNISNEIFSYENFKVALNKAIEKILDKHMYGPSITKPFFPYHKEFMDFLEPRKYAHACAHGFRLKLEGTHNITSGDETYIVLNCKHCGGYDDTMQVDVSVNNDMNSIMVSHNYKHYFVKVSITNSYDVRIRSDKELKLISVNILILPISQKDTVLYIGNFRTSFSTENHVARDFESQKFNIVRLQEDYINANYIRDIAEFLNYKIFLVLYTRTWKVFGNLLDVWRFLESKNITTASYHLDLYYPIKRKDGVPNDPFWRTKYVFLTDFNPKAREFYETLGINARYLKAGVFSEESYMCPYYGSKKYDIVFVGSTNYHKEWPYRCELIKFLRDTYGSRFFKFGNPESVLREHELNKVYAMSKVVVGDTLCVGFNYEEYWSDRLYETTGRGGVLVMPYVGGMDREFKDGESIAYYKFGDFAGLKTIINKYIADDELREQIRKNGFNFTINNCTYKSRIMQLIRELERDKMTDRDGISRIDFKKLIYIKSLATEEYVTFIEDFYPESKQRVVATSSKDKTPFIIERSDNCIFIKTINDIYLHSHYFKVKISDQHEVTLCDIPDDSSVWKLDIQNSTFLPQDIIYTNSRISLQNKHLGSYMHTHYIQHDPQHKQLTTWHMGSPSYEWCFTN